MAYIRTCVQNLGAIRRPVRKTCLSSLIIYCGLIDTGIMLSCRCVIYRIMLRIIMVSTIHWTISARLDICCSVTRVNVFHVDLIGPTLCTVY